MNPERRTQAEQEKKKISCFSLADAASTPANAIGQHKLGWDFSLPGLAASSYSQQQLVSSDFISRSQFYHFNNFKITIISTICRLSF